MRGARFVLRAENCILLCIPGGDMKRLVVAVFLLLALPAFAGEIVIKFAAGAGAPHWITSAKWRGAVGNNGLYYKEYALKVSRRIHEKVIAGSTFGWLNEREFISLIHADVIGASGYRRNRETAYVAPTFSIYAGPFTFDIGGIIYKSYDNIDSKGSPFDEYHGIVPSLGLELGDASSYLALKIFDSFPLYAGGGAEIDLGRRWYGIYEHKIFFCGGIFESMGIGYRSEFKIYRETALSIGLMVGHNDHRDNVYSFTTGIKTAM